MRVSLQVLRLNSLNVIWLIVLCLWRLYISTARFVVFIRARQVFEMVVQLIFTDPDHLIKIFIELICVNKLFFCLITDDDLLQRFLRIGPLRAFLLVGLNWFLRLFRTCHNLWYFVVFSSELVQSSLLFFNKFCLFLETKLDTQVVSLRWKGQHSMVDVRSPPSFLRYEGIISCRIRNLFLILFGLIPLDLIIWYCR